MSARKIYRLGCESYGCTARFVGVETLAGTRRAAANTGWRYVLRTKAQGVAPSLDFCPVHAAEADLPWCPRCASIDVEIDEHNAGTCHAIGCGKLFYRARTEAA